VWTHERKRHPGSPGPLVAVAAALALLCAWPGLARAGEDDPNEPPVVGQPEDFSGAVGEFEVGMTAAPTDVAVEDPITLTVRITVPPKQQEELERKKLKIVPPEGKRLQAKLFPATTRRNFHIQYVPEKDSRAAKPLSWSFVFRLRPKSEKVSQILPVEFVYYSPLSRTYKNFRTRGVIRLKVVERALAKLDPEVMRVPVAPDRFYEVVGGEAVLRRSEHAGEFYPLLLAGLVLGPPGVCAAWYLLWRRLHPGAGWRVRRRRSRAAREALAALQALGRADAGEKTASVLAGYLRQRLELPGAEPTPAEVAAHLRRAGVSAVVTGQVAEFFRACDTARFARGAPPAAGTLAAGAHALVNTLEAELCAS
jgi:hypothetical protein